MQESEGGNGPRACCGADGLGNIVLLVVALLTFAGLQSLYVRPAVLSGIGAAVFPAGGGAASDGVPGPT